MTAQPVERDLLRTRRVTSGPAAAAKATADRQSYRSRATCEEQDIVGEVKSEVPMLMDRQVSLRVDVVA